ncbi:MAG: tRNA 2-selenouridine(34) synthase MnmH [Firmicutes bacterium]|nr:tRNA 2-selenouridine(34) synthase MnmH [Bacillota bacterium]
MVLDVPYEDVLGRRDVVYIDVRSQSEFAESTIPDALSVPLFDDEQRARIGTVYKQAGRERAMDLGLELASARLPALVSEVRALLCGRTPVVFCWRGGMRSRTVTTVLDLMGMPSLRLVGGYRAYRQYIVDEIARYDESDLPRCIVVHGMTGVGKTTLLHLLAARGQPVLDLEGLARHRGSVFGGIGLNPANQRQFDSALFARLRELKSAPHMYMEAESRRVGRATLPPCILAAKEKGIHIELCASMPTRVARTLAQYRLADEAALKSAALHALSRIDWRFPPDLRLQVRAALEEKDYETLVSALLNRYYDPRYAHASAAHASLFMRIDAEDLTRACDDILACTAIGLAQ